jgi:hypothetical protein
MLETKVAETIVQRSHYKRNEPRSKGDGPHRFFDYHRVDLSMRHRYAPLDDLANQNKRRSPRLHFVREHYRHFDNWKTRIPWHYRGDADLGFVDKEYLL